MNKEPNKPIEPSEDASRELTDKELKGIVGGKENFAGGSSTGDIRTFKVFTELEPTEVSK